MIACAAITACTEESDPCLGGVAEMYVKEVVYPEVETTEIDASLVVALLTLSGETTRASGLLGQDAAGGLRLPNTITLDPPASCGLDGELTFTLEGADAPVVDGPISIPASGETSDWTDRESVNLWGLLDVKIWWLAWNS